MEASTIPPVKAARDELMAMLLALLWQKCHFPKPHDASFRGEYSSIDAHQLFEAHGPAMQESGRLADGLIKPIHADHPPTEQAASLARPDGLLPDDNAE